MAANGAVGGRIGDYLLIDQDGKTFHLRELLKRPLVVSFIYTQCSHTCSYITASLANAFKEAGETFGEVFTALTIGFDVQNDTVEAMRAYGESFTDDFTRWRFATAPEDVIKAITEEMGFWYRKRADGTFEHLNMITIIDTSGRVHRQLYGIEYSVEDILKTVYNALESSGPMGALPVTGSSGLFDMLKLMCYTYDETTGTYRPDYTFIISVILGLSIQVIIVFVVVYIFRGRQTWNRRV